MVVEVKKAGVTAEKKKKLMEFLTHWKNEKFIMFYILYRPMDF